MTLRAPRIPYPVPADDERDGLPQWLLTTGHKRIGLLTIGTALVLFFFNGALALTMRAQLAQPSQGILSPQAYLQFMTAHGTGMIAVTITPLALGLGVYLIPLQAGAPRIAAPRATLLGYWLYVFGAIALIWAFVTPGGAQDGWWGYTPLSASSYSPGYGMPLWTAGCFLAACGMILQASTTLWTILRMRAPGVTLMRLPVFAWSQLVTCLMVVAGFPALLLAMGVIVVARISPGWFTGNGWNIAYQNLFWFYALALSVSRRRGRDQRAGWPLPSRPASALLLATGVALIWLGLAFGMWLPVIAIVPLVAALGVELAARRP